MPSEPYFLYMRAFLRSFVATFLALSLGLPNSALALRTQSGLEGTVEPELSAGLEGKAKSEPKKGTGETKPLSRDEVLDLARQGLAIHRSIRSTDLSRPPFKETELGKQLRAALRQVFENKVPGLRGWDQVRELAGEVMAFNADELGLGMIRALAQNPGPYAWWAYTHRRSGNQGPLIKAFVMRYGEAARLSGHSSLQSFHLHENYPDTQSKMWIRDKLNTEVFPAAISPGEPGSESPYLEHWRAAEPLRKMGGRKIFVTPFHLQKKWDLGSGSQDNAKPLNPKKVITAILFNLETALSAKTAEVLDNRSILLTDDDLLQLSEAKLTAEHLTPSFLTWLYTELNRPLALEEPDDEAPIDIQNAWGSDSSRRLRDEHLLQKIFLYALMRPSGGPLPGLDDDWAPLLEAAGPGSPPLKAYSRSSYSIYASRHQKPPPPPEARRIFIRKMNLSPAAATRPIKISLYVPQREIAQNALKRWAGDVSARQFDDLNPNMLVRSTSFKFRLVPIGGENPAPKTQKAPGVILWDTDNDEGTSPPFAPKLPVLQLEEGHRLPTLAQLIKIALFGHEKAGSLPVNSIWIFEEDEEYFLAIGISDKSPAAGLEGKAEKGSAPVLPKAIELIALGKEVLAQYPSLRQVDIQPGTVLGDSPLGEKLRAAYRPVNDGLVRGIKNWNDFRKKAGEVMQFDADAIGLAIIKRAAQNLRPYVVQTRPKTSRGKRFSAGRRIAAVRFTYDAAAEFSGDPHLKGYHLMKDYGDVRGKVGIRTKLHDKVFPAALSPAPPEKTDPYWEHWEAARPLREIQVEEFMLHGESDGSRSSGPTAPEPLKNMGPIAKTIIGNLPPQLQHRKPNSAGKLLIPLDELVELADGAISKEHLTWSDGSIHEVNARLLLSFINRELTHEKPDSSMRLRAWTKAAPLREAGIKELGIGTPSIHRDLTIPSLGITTPLPALTVREFQRLFKEQAGTVPAGARFVVFRSIPEEALLAGGGLPLRFYTNREADYEGIWEEAGRPGSAAQSKARELLSFSNTPQPQREVVLIQDDRALAEEDPFGIGIYRTAFPKDPLSIKPKMPAILLAPGDLFTHRLDQLIKMIWLHREDAANLPVLGFWLVRRDGTTYLAAALPEIPGALLPSGLEAAVWLDRLDSALHGWQERGWISDAELLMTEFRKAAEQLRGDPDRPSRMERFLELFSHFTEALRRPPDESGLRARVNRGVVPERRLSATSYEAQLDFEKPGTQEPYRIGVKIVSASKYHQIYIGVWQPRQTSRSARLIGTLRIEKDRDHPQIHFHLRDTLDSDHNWFDSGKEMDAVWSGNVELGNPIDVFTRFQEALQGYIEALPLAAPDWSQIGSISAEKFLSLRPQDQSWIPETTSQLLVLREEEPVTFYRPTDLAKDVDRLIREQGNELPARIRPRVLAIPASPDRLSSRSLLFWPRRHGPPPVTRRPVIHQSPGQPFHYTLPQLLAIAATGRLEAAERFLDVGSFEENGRRYLVLALDA